MIPDILQNVQITWFKREKDVVWVQKDQLGQEEETILAFMLEELKKRNIPEVQE